MKRNRILLVSAAGVGLAAAVVLSAGSSPQLQPHSASASHRPSASVLLSSPPHQQFGVNAQGKTFGSALGIESPTQLPDLIKVKATNGAVGYITKTVFLGASPTLQQVLGYARNAHGNLVAPALTVPVYASNGTSQVGTFTVGGASATNTRTTTSATPSGS